MQPARDHWTFWSLTLGGIALGVSGLLVVASLVQFWGMNSQYADRFIILLAVGWLVWRVRESLPPSTGSNFGLIPLLAGSVAAAPAWYLAAQVGPRSILLWWLAGAWLLSAVGAVLLLGGWRWLRPLAFPLFFVLFALPIPERIEVPLQEELQERTTTLAAAGMRAAGMTVERHGFELHLPSGGLEVVEACSGVRSITALLAIALFVAHWRGFGLIRGLLTLGLALPVIAAVNALRIIITGWIQETYGQQMIQGRPHELLGFVMVLVGLAFVLLISQLLRPHGPRAEAPQSPVTTHHSPFTGLPYSVRLSLGACLLAVGLAGSAGAYVLGQGRIVRHLQTAPFEQLPAQFDEWTATDVDIPEETRDILTYDRALYRKYRDELGHELEVWVIYWEASTAIRGYHHPDVCSTNRGWATILKDRQPLELDDGRLVPLTIRHYERERNRRRVVYWTQEGRRIWSEQDEDNADKSGPGHSWIRDRLVEHPPEMSARLSVLIQTDLWGRTERTERMVDDFTKRFARQLFAVCPWARPEPAAP